MCHTCAIALKHSSWFCLCPLPSAMRWVCLRQGRLPYFRIMKLSLNCPMMGIWQVVMCIYIFFKLYSHLDVEIVCYQSTIQGCLTDWTIQQKVPGIKRCRENTAETIVSFAQPRNTCFRKNSLYALSALGQQEFQRTRRWDLVREPLFRVKTDFPWVQKEEMNVLTVKEKVVWFVLIS